MDKRVYRVETPKGTKLIKAATPSQAIAHAVRAQFSARVATQEDLIELLGDGIAPEEAGAIE